MTVLARLVARIMFLLLLFGDLMVIASFYLSPWGFFILGILIAPALWMFGSLTLLSSGEARKAILFATWPVWFAVGLIGTSLFAEKAVPATLIFGIGALNAAVIYATHLVLGRPRVARAEPAG